MLMIACLSSWDHAGRRSRRDFGRNRSSRWSFCQRNRVRRGTPTIFVVVSADTSCRQISRHWFSAHRRAFSSRRRFHFSGDTSLEPGRDLQDAGGGTGRDRWYDFIGGSLFYRFCYPQNENLHPTRQGQSIPRTGHETRSASCPVRGTGTPNGQLASYLPSAFSCVFPPACRECHMCLIAYSRNGLIHSRGGGCRTNPDRMQVGQAIRGFLHSIPGGRACQLRPVVARATSGARGSGSI